jgi:acetyl esterase
MEDWDALTLADRLEMAGARVVASLPASAKRRIAGKPIHRDGLELDLDMQVLLKLEQRNPRPPLSSGTPARARQDLRHSVRVVAGAPVALADVREPTAPCRRACSCRRTGGTRVPGR